MNSQSKRPTVLVVQYANPDHYPPTFNAVSLLAEEFEVRIFCRKSDREVRLWPRNVRLERVGPSLSTAEAAAASARDKLAEYAQFVWALRRAIERERPAVVLAYEPHGYSAVVLTGTNKPIVYQRHEVEELSGPTDRRSLGGWIYALARKRSSQAARMVFPQTARADYYQQFVPLPRPPLVVPNFPLLESFSSPDFAQLLPRREARRKLLYRGLMGPANGIVEAVQSLGHLPAAISLQLAGPASPAFEAELASAIQTAGLTSRIERLGFVPFDELNALTREASIGLMLYQAVDTNWGNIASSNNKVCEYAACGVPSVVPDREDFRQLFRGDSWIEFADPKDPKAVAVAAQRLLSSPSEYNERARAARRRVEEHFNYRRVFQPMLDEIRSLARR
jgi:glycosyltransferase involved in cell wall biosynthesis